MDRSPSDRSASPVGIFLHGAPRHSHAGHVSRGMLAVGLLAGLAAHAMNLVNNGGFESPDIAGYPYLSVGDTSMPGWTVVGNTIQLTDNGAFSALGVYSSEGAQFLDLTGNVGQGGGVLSNTIATTIGTQCTLALLGLGLAGLGLSRPAPIRIGFHGTICRSPCRGDWL